MTSDSFGNKILTFREKMAIKKAEQSITDAEARPRIEPTMDKPPPKPRAEGRDRDDDLIALDDLIDNCKLSGWEMNFCKSVRTQLNRHPDNSMSAKQAVIVDKLVNTFLESSSDPTPKGNPPARFMPVAQKPYPKADKFGFDDMNDDIPF